MNRIFAALAILALLGLSLGNGPASASSAALADPDPIREISYYPRDYAWEEFWPNWDDAKIQMDADLDRIVGLGANTVRIFLHPGVMGYPTPTAGMLANFEEALALIATHGLKAHANLFDCSEPYNEIANSQTWLAAVVGPHANDARIALWELRNEVNLDDQPTRDWVQALFPYLKQQAGSTPATVSVANVAWLDDLAALTGATPPDLYSLHWYPRGNLTWTSTLPATLAAALVAVPADKLLLGEFGISTYEYSDASQANLYRDVLYYASQKGVTNLGVWTLNDFPFNTARCGGEIPGALEWRFGLYREDGAEKPAAVVLRDAFLNGETPGPVRSTSLLNPSFEVEDPDSHEIDNWWGWDQTWSGVYYAARDGTHARTGEYAALLDGPDDIVVGLFHAPAIEVNPRWFYSLEAYAWTEDLHGRALVVLSWYSWDGENEVWLGQTTAETTTPEAGWTRLFIDRAQPPPGAEYVRVFVEMGSMEEESRVWFDDARLWVQQVYLPVIRR